MTILLAALLLLSGCGKPGIPIDSANGSLSGSGLYLMQPGSPQHARSADPDRPYETFRVNNRGFRDADFSRSTATIFLAGDSIVYGTGLRTGETLDRQLEEKFRRAGRAVQVFNLGVPGYNLRSQLMLAETLVPEYAPSAVVFFFGPRDDLVRFDVSAMLRVKQRSPWLYGIFLPFSPLVQKAERTFLYHRLKKQRLAELIRPHTEGRGLSAKTKILFFTINPDAELVELLSRAGLELIWDDFSPCAAAACTIPNDGHPNAFLNGLRAKILHERLAPLFPAEARAR